MVDDVARQHGLPKMAGAANSRDAGRSGRRAAFCLPDPFEEGASQAKRSQPIASAEVGVTTKLGRLTGEARDDRAAAVEPGARSFARPLVLVLVLVLVRVRSSGRAFDARVNADTRRAA
ncbi:hypothetical protein BTI_5322 [Burkholderia thailandensis MSMB121]|nr:hypothetical protein BTI_5322 [Burkholderia thailandensis MSMB121]